MRRLTALLLAIALPASWPGSAAVAQVVRARAGAPVLALPPSGFAAPAARAPAPGLAATLPSPALPPSLPAAAAPAPVAARAAASPAAASPAAAVRALAAMAAPAAVPAAAKARDEGSSGAPRPVPPSEPGRPTSDEAAASGAGRRFDLSGPSEPAAEPVPAGSPAASRTPVLAPADEAAGAPSAAVPAPGGKVRLPRTVWGTIIGHGVLTVFGIELHVISQPFLVMETLGQSKTMMGVVRNVHSGSFSLVNLLPVGFLVDKTDFRALFIGTSLARALMMGAIPALWATGHLSIAALLVIVALNPLFQTTMVVAERAAVMAAVGTDEKMNKEATAVMSKWESLAGLFLPLGASYLLGLLVGHFGLGGYALAYGVYAAMLVASVPLYWLMVRDPRDPEELGAEGLKRFVAESGRFMGAILWALLTLPWRLLKALAALAKRRAPAPGPAPGALKERAAAWLDGHESTKGLAYILRNRTLSILMAVGAVEAFLVEALPMVVLPNFIVDVLGAAPAGVPVLGTLLATSGGILGLMFSAEYVGRFLSSWYMEGERGDRLTARVGARGLYRAAAVSSLLFWLMWLVPSFAGGGFWLHFGTVVAVMGLIQLFHAPVGILLAPLKRAQIPDEMLGRVESAFDMVDLALASAGALLAGAVMDLFGIQTAMALVAAAVTATAVFQWAAARWLYPKTAAQAPTTSPASAAGTQSRNPSP